MITMCSWCGIIMGDTVKEALSDAPTEKVTHGICAPCAVNLEREIDKMDDDSFKDAGSDGEVARHHA